MIHRNNVTLEGHQLVDFRVHNVLAGTDPAPSATPGRLYYWNSPLADAGLYWADNDAIAWPIPRPWGPGLPVPPTGALVAPIIDIDTANADWAGITITADRFIGPADLATALESSRHFSITGKAAAAAVGFNGTGNVALNVTALTVYPADIQLAGASGEQLIVSGGAGVGVAVLKSNVPLSGFGNPTASVPFGGQRLTDVATPVAGTDAANKSYVDSAVAGTAPSAPCRLATAAALAAYTASGSPATLTASANGALSIDGTAVVNGDRVLIKNESGANEKYNGVYTVTQAGTAGTPWILNRASDENSDAEVNTGDEFFITSGSTNAATSWALATLEPITLGTTALQFVQTGGSQAYTAGNGLVQVGNVFHVAQSSGYDVGGSGATPAVGRVPYTSATNALSLTGSGAENKVLRCAVGQSFPSWGAINLASSDAVSGTLAVANGGTARSTGFWTAGDLVYASANNVLDRVALAATGNALIAGVSGPQWGKIGLSTHVDGTLGAANGGTGRSTLTLNAVLYGTGAAAVGLASPSGAGQLLASAPTPTFVTPSGDVAMTAAGAFTIQPGVVIFAKMQNVSSGVVAGRLMAGPGVMSEITLAALGNALYSGGHIPTPSTTLTGDVTGGPSVGTVATTIANLALSKLATGSARSVVGVAVSGVHADIPSSAGGQTLRVNDGNTVLEFGALNLANANSVSGTLPALRGGTGVSRSDLVFPNARASVVAMVYGTLAQGSASYTVNHPFGTYIVAPTLLDSSGNVVGADIVTAANSVTVTFGSVTTQSHTLIIIGTPTLTEALP